MTLSLTSLLSTTLTTSAQSQAQVRINAIQNTLTNRLKSSIAQVQAQSSDPSTVQVLRSQLSNLSKQNTAYSQASSQLVQNEQFLTDLRLQLTGLSTAAAAGDSVTFDSDLAKANVDVTDLNVQGFLAGFQSDGVVNLKLSGLGIKSSATYDLSTAAGRTQAAADVQSAQNVVNQIVTVTTQNQLVAASASSALSTQISDIDRRLSELSGNQSGPAQKQIAKLQQQEQQQFHVIELQLGGSTNANSVLATGSAQLASVLASQPGSRTAPKTNQFISALQNGLNIANQLNSTKLSAAIRQPNGSTTENNGIRQSAIGSLLNIFS